MKVGTFNINNYLERLTEAEEEAKESTELSDKVNQTVEEDSSDDSTESTKPTSSNEISSNKDIKVEGGISSDSTQGLIIPDENKNSFNWLKRSYDSSKVEVKVEIRQGGSSFEPSVPTSLTSKDSDVKEFKPGVFGNEGTAKAPEGMDKGSESTPKNLNAKEDEVSTAEVKSKSNISIKAKTIEDGSNKDIKEDTEKKTKKTKTAIKAKRRINFKPSKKKDDDQ